MAAEDPVLLQRYVADGDQAAFAELVRRYVNLVYFAALRQMGGDVHRAEEVVQVVFTRLAGKAGALMRHQTIAGWLHTTTRVVASEARRAEVRRKKREWDAQIMREATNDSAVGGEWENLRPVIDAVLGELSDCDREAVALRFFANRPLAEIGSALSVSENTARMRVERALEKLRARLAGRGITSTSAALGVLLANEAALAAPAGLAASVAGTALVGAGAGATAGAAGVLTGIFQILSTTKVAVGVFAVLGLAGIGVGLRESSAARETEKQRVAAAAQLAMARPKIAALEKQIGEVRVQAQATSIPAPSPASSVASNSGAPASASPPVRSMPAVNSLEACYASPEYIDLALNKFRLSVGLKYGPFYKAAQLTPDEIARFENALNEREQGTLEIWSSAAAEGVSLNDPSILSLTTEPALAAHRKLREILGEPRYAEYRHYENTNSARAIVASLAGNLYYTPTPLQAEQAELVARTMVDSSEAKKIPLGADRQGKMIYSVSTEIDWAKVQNRLEGNLAPTQVATLRVLVEQDRLQTLLSKFAQTMNQPSPKQVGPKSGG